MARSAML